MSIFAQAHEMLLKTHTIPQVQPNFTMCVSLYRLQLEKYAFIVTFQILFLMHLCREYAHFYSEKKTDFAQNLLRILTKKMTGKAPTCNSTNSISNEICR